MVHRFRRPRREGYFQHAHKGVLEKNTMTLGRRLNGVIPVWETGLGPRCNVSAKCNYADHAQE